MRQIIKKIVHPFLKKWYSIKNSKPQKFSRDNVEITVYPGVFHPGIFLSTNLLINFLTKLPLNKKKVLELGAGSGFISFYLAIHNNTIPSASDINKKALQGLEENSKQLKVDLEIINSDLFDSIDPINYDYIIINPPYYPKNPLNETEQAFYCGEDYEYFEKLFKQLNEKWSKKQSSIIMILSEDCAIDKIKQVATKNKIQLHLKEEVQKMKEKNYIFEILQDE